MVKKLPAMQETRVRSLDQEDPLEKEMATHSSTLAWETLWTEEPGGLQSIRLQRLGHDWSTNTTLFQLILLHLALYLVCPPLPHYIIHSLKAETMSHIFIHSFQHFEHQKCLLNEILPVLDGNYINVSPILSMVLFRYLHHRLVIYFTINCDWKQLAYAWTVMPLDKVPWRFWLYILYLCL